MTYSNCSSWNIPWNVRISGTFECASIHSKLLRCRGLNRSLVADGHDPLAVPLDPQPAHMNRLARIRLVQASHDHRIAKIKHLRAHQRCRGGADSTRLLFVQSLNAPGLRNHMIAVRTDLHKLIRDVWRPRLGIMRGYTGLQRLPR